MTQKQKETTGIEYGALVISVGKGSPADIAGIRYPDIIVEVNEEKVASFIDCVAKIQKSEPAVKLKMIKWAEEVELVPKNWTGGLGAF